MYRDRAPMCPHCGIELARPDDKQPWRCAKCKGTLIKVTDVVRGMLAIDADLLDDTEIRDLDTEPRIADTVVVCPICASPFEPVLLQGIALERCRQDEVLWFDGWEALEMLAKIDPG